MNNAFLRDAVAAVRNNKHEICPDRGLFVPAAGAFLGGLFTGRYAEPGSNLFGPEHLAPNRVVGEGLNLILNLVSNHASIPSGLYLAPFSGNITPADGLTAATFTATATEFVGYDEATRPVYTTVTTTTKQLTNAAALAAATITFAAGGPYTVRGCGLLSSSVKSGTAGVLVVAARFDADLTGMTAGGKLALQYDLGAVDEADA